MFNRYCQDIIYFVEIYLKLMKHLLFLLPHDDPVLPKNSLVLGFQRNSLKASFLVSCWGFRKYWCWISCTSWCLYMIKFYINFSILFTVISRQIKILLSRFITRFAPSDDKPNWSRRSLHSDWYWLWFSLIKIPSKLSSRLIKPHTHMNFDGLNNSVNKCDLVTC